ncbi:MAG: RIP metalloprotease RseP [Alphaproteobacteria bacterium]
MTILENVFYYVVPFLIILGILVFVHEFGHFIVARIFGLKVEEFSIGFGKKLCGFFDKKGTEWKICLIPLGGYVKMFGDENAASANSGKANELTEEEKKVTLEFQHPFKKLLVVFAGPFFNYLFAFAIFSCIFFFVGKVYYPPVVGDVVANSPAEEVGILPNDKVISINGFEIETFDDIRQEVALSVDEKTKIVIDREGKLVDFEVVLRSLDDGEDKKKMLGVVSLNDSTISLQSMGFFQSIKEGAVKTWDLTTMTLRGVGQMITGQRSGDEVGGIIRIAELSGDVSKNKSFTDLFMFMALLSVNLGLINLFPIPVLDGGHILIYAIEIVTGKKVSDKVKEFLAKIGFAVIMALLIFATYNDVARFF